MKIKYALFFLSALLILGSSCKKDNDETGQPSPLVGTWKHNQQWGSGEYDTNIDFVLQFTNETIEYDFKLDRYETQNPENVDSVRTHYKGTYAILNENLVEINITESTESTPFELGKMTGFYILKGDTTLQWASQGAIKYIKLEGADNVLKNSTYYATYEVLDMQGAITKYSFVVTHFGESTIEYYECENTVATLPENWGEPQVRPVTYQDKAFSMVNDDDTTVVPYSFYQNNMYIPGGLEFNKYAKQK